MQPRQWIIDSKLQMEHVCNFLLRLPVDSSLHVSVGDYEPQRSNAQNARLWMLHSKAAGITGYSAEEMHEFALMRHFGHHDIVVGELIRRVPVKRSSSRNKKEFSDFMEATEAWYINDFGVWLE